MPTSSSDDWSVMVMPDALALGGAGLVVACLVLYVFYSQTVIIAPRVADALRPLLLWPRRLALVAGVLCSLAGIVLSPEGANLVAGLAAALGMRHANRRQWAFGLTPAPHSLLTDVSSDLPVVKLPDGGAVPVHWLQQARLVRIKDFVLVGCSLAGSISAFRAPPGSILVLYPLDVGFAIGGSRAWSGVSGLALDDGPHLEAVDLEFTNAENAQHVFGPPGGIRGSRTRRVVRIPGAQASGADDVGLVSGGTWTSAPFPVDAAQPRRYLARWAARQSGLTDQ